jgi:stage II sporulation protein M
MDPEIGPRPEGPVVVPAAPERPPGPLGSLYREEREAWRRHYRRYFKYAARALGLGFVAGFAYFMLWPARERKALEFVVESLKDVPLEASPLVLALTLFYHNTRASIVAVAAGIVPFLFLPLLDPVINGGVLGLLCSISQHQGLNVPKLVLTQILPHGVFELTAVLYATSVGLHVCAGVGRKLRAAWRDRRRARPEATSPPTSPAPAAVDEALSSDAPHPSPEATPGPEAEREGACEGGLFRDVVRSFALVVIPLLFIAALIEGLVTPLLH